jgi:hypothetical protein
MITHDNFDNKYEDIISFKVRTKGNKNKLVEYQKLTNYKF